MRRFIGDLIYSDQTGYVPNRYIGTNIRTVEDVINYANITKKSSLILAIDFHKAFDSISWSAICEALQVYGFGEKYIEWVQLIYKDISTCVSNNGYNSKWFQPTRGTRQGCCLSPFLFILVIELFASAIRKEEKIKGVNIDSKEIKLTMLADDVTCFLKDPQSLFYVLDFLERFRRYSGLKINKDKSTVLVLGRHDDTELNKIPLGCAADITILGIKMSQTRTENLHYEWNYIKTGWKDVEKFVTTGEIGVYLSKEK